MNDHRARRSRSLLGLRLLLLTVSLFAASAAWATQVTFRYQPVIGGVSSVAVAGSFNGWNASDKPLA